MRAPLFERLRNETRNEQAYLIGAPQIQAALAGKISKDTYRAYLAEAYHHVKHTAPLMQKAREHLTPAQQRFAGAFDEYIAEETGHEEWILSDIRAAGGDEEAIRRSDPLPATEFMVAYAYDYVTRVNALGLLGMVYVLEGTSVALAQQGAAAVGEALCLSPDCFTYLNSHGALDQSHMGFFESLMARIDDPKDQDSILHVAKRIFLLFGGVFRSIPM